MGADGELAGLDEIHGYFKAIAAASDRVEIVDAGPTTDGNRLIGAIVSAPENIARLSEIQAANKRLAHPRTLSDAEAAQLAAEQKIVVAIGCSIHATEVGATQAANELLHSLATATDPASLAILQNVIVILIPSLNPDGHALVIDWYRKTRGTQYEAAPMPWLYHRYAGHDINRDAFMMNMVENRSLARFFYSQWHPQVFLTMHQMGVRGPRFFVPPVYEPIDPNYDPLIWRQAGLLGHAMALELERNDRAGVVSNALFDYYWPGYEDSAPLGHNTVCLLTEVASARLAWPITVPPGDLQTPQRGLPEYRQQQNFPNPWDGGIWRLRDIVDYDLIAVRGLLDATARYRQQIVENFYRMGKRAVTTGEREPPFAFLIPPDQHDRHAAARLTGVLIDGAIEVQRAEETFSAGGTEYPAGTAIVLMAQPFRAYAKTLLERQQYPIRRPAPNVPPERPYDVAGWTLPYQMGVKVDEVPTRFDLPLRSRLTSAPIEAAAIAGPSRPAQYVIDGRGNGAAIAANRLLAAGLGPAWSLEPITIDGATYARGAITVKSSNAARKQVEGIVRSLGLRASASRRAIRAPTLPLKRARIGLYRSWLENIDEGWTRWILEQYEFPFSTLRDADIRAGGLRKRFDAIILPDATPEQIHSGHRPGTVPPEYSDGLGDSGTAALREFVDAGGTLVALDSAGAFLVSALNLPITDVANTATQQEFFCPGSILRLQLDPAQPLAFGMPEETAAFFAYSAAYDVKASAPPMTEGHGGTAAASSSPRVIARYGTSDLLMSGWLEGGERIAGRAAVVEARVGTGRGILIGFRAQHRAQSHATFRLLFNALLTAGGI
jgi:hypothetical protein